MILALTMLSTVVEALKIFSTMLLHASLLVALLTVTNAAPNPFTSFICNYKALTEHLDRMTLSLFHGSMKKYTEVPVARAVELMKEIDKSKRTVIIVAHYMGSAVPGEQADIMKAYLSVGYYNVMWLKWKDISDNQLYTFGVCSTPDVGIYVGKALNEMVALGLDPTTLSLVGHSLGGQAVGAIGRSTNFTVGMIVGLDPAGPGFDLIPLVPSLSSNDAAFVIGIHTDRGAAGVNLPVGHVDIYPNNGNTPQPGCIPIGILSDPCSHGRGTTYWVEAVANPKAFLARKCDSWDDFKAGLCDLNRVIEMSPDTPTDARGSYFLHTGGKSPFGVGVSGTHG